MLRVLTALTNENQVISLLVQPNPQKQPFRCPACGSPVRLRQGKIIRPHFAHITLANCHFQTENESQEHLHLKAKIYTSLIKTEKVCVEKYLPELQQFPDLWVNDKLALEIQCSPIPIERLVARTQAYQKHGYEVRWLLGKKLWLKNRLTAFQKQCLYFSSRLGFHLWELDTAAHLLRLKYLIHEDLFDKVSYLTKTISLDNNIMESLRIPYHQSKLCSYQKPMAKSLSIPIQRALLAKHPKWLRRQERAYLAGYNLLMLPVEAFYPQWRPVQSATGFCQIKENLHDYNKSFKAYYKKEGNKKVQTLFSPQYYVKIVSNRK
ncbi:competence protein CoiA family protein [Streptococcus dysgalactiae subsp. equisimilis]|uniref:Competence protein CoiA family protein n=3 Tax=Streptococcus TaxID=1301 RepID=A0AB38XZM7_STREQ|nr:MULTISPECIES: competence protein CoiA family protein [Streptococcus]EGL48751.1 competence protein CoiA-like protein [Streptococcus dysgalactiae subsp. equisimilis SK1249]KKC18542.1 competence protein CoiA [Streptococcus dysgalactiae subsp. equisimilis]KKC20517.1 competence protein CoiA [Streptococcus dysgalactiae subsp. equisimilis]KKC22726.1 competence protein CoiA [Streptococcus dysgalactiae subsp. equisimilis]MBM6513311.1 competence protein CoiA [Streptococcus dysgalactiae subsp. equisim